MKLISCHIDNFGILHNADFKFDEKLTEIKDDNGKGKTTLANFVASMFYGLPSLREQLISDNERRRYTPFQGGKYGGSLIFEVHNKRYEVKRTFDDSGSRDKFLLEDAATKREVKEIGKRSVDSGNLGEVLFGIDKSSFVRSIFVPQGDIAFSADKKYPGKIESGLNEKLRNLINATDANNSYDSVMEILDKAAEGIRSKRGYKGKLTAVEIRIKELSGKIEECNAFANSAELDRSLICKDRERLKSLQDEIKEIEQKIDKQKDLATLREQQARYIEMKKNLTENIEALKKLTYFFNGQSVDEAYLAKIRNAINNEKLQRETADKIRKDTLEEKARLESLKSNNETRQALKEMLESQKSAAEEKKESLSAECANLRKNQKKPSILLVILTAGILFLVWRNKQKKIASQLLQNEREIENCKKELLRCKQGLAAFEEAGNAGTDDSLKQLEERLKKEEELHRTLSSETEALLSKFNCTKKEQLLRYAEIENAHEELNRRNDNYKKTERELREFLDGKDEAQLASAIANDISSAGLQQEKRQKENERNALADRISKMEADAERKEAAAADLADYEEEKADCKNKEEKLLFDLDIIGKTKKFLTEANDSLASRYLVPLNGKCRELIESFDKEKSVVEIDADSKILIREKGDYRELDYFSAGNKELISLCMRFALIDLIFEDDAQKPCIILDDPFVNLDDKKILKAKELLKQLAEKYQIIYFTCSESRSVKNKK